MASLLPGPSQGPQEYASLGELPVRGRIRASGFIESIRILPPDLAPTFSADVVDAPAPPGGRRAPVPRIRLVWTGQRRVPGIDAATRLRFEGMVSLIDGTPTVFNPRYEILADEDESTEEQG